jgi:hypothetical protein
VLLAPERLGLPRFRASFARASCRTRLSYEELWVFFLYEKAQARGRKTRDKRCEIPVSESSQFGDPAQSEVLFEGNVGFFQ